MKKVTCLMMLALGISAVSSNINANLRETKQALAEANTASYNESARHEKEMKQYRTL